MNRLIALSSQGRLLVLLVTTSLTSVVSGQVTTVINVPPDAAPNSIGSDTQLNVFDGGVLADGFDAGYSDGSSRNVEVNIFGGAVGDFFEARSGSTVNVFGGSLGSYFFSLSESTVNISGGAVGSRFAAHSGSLVTISGGTVGRSFIVLPGSEVTISGGEFLLNGVAPTGAPVTLTGSEVLTGTLEDGSPFIFSPLASDQVNDVTLASAPLPVLDIAPITVDSENAPNGLREGQTLTLQEGGVLGENFAAVNATLSIAGGRAGDGLEVVGSQVSISGGTVGDVFAANSDSEVTISGGTIGGSFRANSGSVVTISGGTVGSNFEADPGSEVTFSGGEFLLNGVAPAGSTVTLTDFDVLTGTLEDGSPFIFSPLASDQLNDVTLRVAPLPVLDTESITVDSDDAPIGLRDGQTLTLQDGGILGDNFAAVIATLNIAGGRVGDGLEVIDSQVTISGGTVGSNFAAFSGSEVTISGGMVDRFFTARSGSEVAISGGTIGRFFTASSGSVVTISGGTVGDDSDSIPFSQHTSSDFYASSGSQVTISGGTVGGDRGFLAGSGSEVTISGGTIAGHFAAGSGSEVTISGGTMSEFGASSGSAVDISGGTFGRSFYAASGSEVTISGGEFLLNGATPAGSTVTVADFDVLTGTLEDGSPFIFSALADDRLNEVTLASAPLPVLDTTPIIVDSDNAPIGLRDGQTLTLQDGGILGDNFAAVNATLNIAGGRIGDGLEVIDSQVTISGGTVGSSFAAFSGSEVDLIGTQFALDDMDITDMIIQNVPVPIDSRDVTLNGTLVDGSQFSFDLNSFAQGDEDFFDDATLTVTLRLCGDYDVDGDVDVADRTIQTQNWTGALSPGAGERTFAQGDCDGDGDVDVADQTGTIQNWTGAMEIPLGNMFPEGIFDVQALSATFPLAEYANDLSAGGTLDLIVVPEPYTAALAVIGVFLLCHTRRQR